MKKSQIKNKVLNRYNCIKNKKSTFVSVDKL
jgi:hypothetical protein